MFTTFIFRENSQKPILGLEILKMAVLRIFAKFFIAFLESSCPEKSLGKISKLDFNFFSELWLVKGECRVLSAGTVCYLLVIKATLRSKNPVLAIKPHPTSRLGGQMFNNCRFGIVGLTSSRPRAGAICSPFYWS